MSSRLDNRTIMNNRHQLYRRKCKKRGLSYFRHFDTPRFTNVTTEQMKDMDIVEVLWHPGDRLYKLANTHYGDPELWWVIAWFNEKPTDAHFSPGDPVLVPNPIEELLTLFAETG